VGYNRSHRRDRGIGSVVDTRNQSLNCLCRHPDYRHLYMKGRFSKLPHLAECKDCLCEWFEPDDKTDFDCFCQKSRQPNGKHNICY
jgi:hypothetical protein